MNESFEFTWPERRQEVPGPKPPTNDTPACYHGNWLVMEGTIINIGLKNYFEMLAGNSVADLAAEGKAKTPLAVYRLEQMKSAIENIKRYSLEELQLLVFALTACPENVTHVYRSQ